MTEQGFGVFNFNLCFVFALDCFGVVVSNVDTLFLLGNRCTDRTVPVGFGNRYFCIVDGLGGSFLTEGGVFPKALITKFIATKRSELRDISKIPTPMEFEKYFNL